MDWISAVCSSDLWPRVIVLDPPEPPQPAIRAAAPRSASVPTPKWARTCRARACGKRRDVSLKLVTVVEPNAPGAVVCRCSFGATYAHAYTRARGAVHQDKLSRLAGAGGDVWL